MRDKKMSKKEWLIKMLIDEMFLIAGHPDVTYEDILGRKDPWYVEYTMTWDQNQQFKKAGIEIMRREMKLVGLESIGVSFGLPLIITKF